jgi:hypothetical protein
MDFKVVMELAHPAGGGGEVELLVHPEWAPLGAKCVATLSKPLRRGCCSDCLAHCSPYLLVRAI